MTLFAVFATLLVVVVAAFILPPLWLGLKPAVGNTDRRAANLAIFRDQLAELEREKREGSLADTDFEQAKRELHHRLLAEVESAAPAEAGTPQAGTAEAGAAQGRGAEAQAARAPQAGGRGRARGRARGHPRLARQRRHWHCRWHGHQHGAA